MNGNHPETFNNLFFTFSALICRLKGLCASVWSSTHVFGLLSIFCDVMLVEWFNFSVVNAVVMMKEAVISATYLMSDVLTVLLRKIEVFWDVMLCS